MFSLARGADNLLIGRFFGAAASVSIPEAPSFSIRPLQQFIIPINTVLIPALSRIQSEPDRYRRTFLQVFEAIALMSFLFAGLFLALSYPLTLAVLGPKWEAAAVIFAYFTVAALAYPLTTASTWLFATQGRGKDWVLTSSIISCVTLCSFLAGLPFGPAGCGDILFGFVCPDTVAIRLSHGRPARSGERETSVDRMLAAFAYLGSGLRYGLAGSYVWFCTLIHGCNCSFAVQWRCWLGPHTSSFLLPLDGWR